MIHSLIPHGRRRPSRILVVEDDPEIRSMLCLFLRQCSFRIVEAADGLEGLCKAMEQKFDLVVTDWQMPHLDGLTLCNRLSLDLPYEVPILVTSGTPDPDFEAIVRRHGGSAFLKKLFLLTELQDHIETLLSQDAEIAAPKQLG